MASLSFNCWSVARPPRQFASSTSGHPQRTTSSMVPPARSSSCRRRPRTSESASRAACLSPTRSERRPGPPTAGGGFRYEEHGYAMKVGSECSNALNALASSGYLEGKTQNTPNSNQPPLLSLSGPHPQQTLGSTIPTDCGPVLTHLDPLPPPTTTTVLAIQSQTNFPRPAPIKIQMMMYPLYCGKVRSAFDRVGGIKRGGGRSGAPVRQEVYG